LKKQNSKKITRLFYLDYKLQKDMEAQGVLEGQNKLGYTLKTKIENF
jgi:hypothetical protein